MHRQRSGASKDDPNVAVREATQLQAAIETSRQVQTGLQVPSVPRGWLMNLYETSLPTGSFMSKQLGVMVQGLAVQRAARGNGKGSAAYRRARRGQNLTNVQQALLQPSSYDRLGTPAVSPSEGTQSRIPATSGFAASAFDMSAAAVIPQRDALSDSSTRLNDWQRQQR